MQVTRIACKPSFLKDGKPVEGTLRNRLKWRAITLCRKFKFDLDYWFEALATWRFLLKRHRQFDVIHAFGRNSVIFTAVSFAKVFRIPLMIELVNLDAVPDPREPWLIRTIWGSGLPKGTRIVAISTALEKVCHEHGYSPSCIWRRPNPVDETRFYPEIERKSEYRQRLAD